MSHTGLRQDSPVPARKSAACRLQRSSVRGGAAASSSAMRGSTWGRSSLDKIFPFEGTNLFSGKCGYALALSHATILSTLKRHNFPIRIAGTSPHAARSRTLRSEITHRIERSFTVINVVSAILPPVLVRNLHTSTAGNFRRLWVPSRSVGCWATTRPDHL